MFFFSSFFSMDFFRRVSFDFGTALFIYWVLFSFSQRFFFKKKKFCKVFFHYKFVAKVFLRCFVKGFYPKVFLRVFRRIFQVFICFANFVFRVCFFIVSFSNFFFTRSVLSEGFFFFTGRFFFQVFFFFKKIFFSAKFLIANSFFFSKKNVS